MDNEVFRLYSSCILVKGVLRAVICDLQRDDLFFVSLPYYDLLNSTRNLSLDKIILDYKEKFSENEILSFYNDLTNKELGFWTSEPDRFPEIDLSWENPSIITNAIIDQDNNSNHNFEIIFSKLETVGCRDVQIRCYNTLNISKMSEILNLLDGKRIKSVEFIIKYDSSINLQEIENLTSNYARIKSIIMHSSPYTKVHQYKGPYEVHMGNIIITEQVIDSNQCCGIISPNYFNIGISTFTEGQDHNTCLNRKIGIDTDGSIKNCPSLKKVYGNIYESDIVSLVYGERFQELWKINKDKIETCKVCEFRYVCTDCRAFLESDLSLKKPLKCNYDPYSLEWKD